MEKADIHTHPGKGTVIFQFGEFSNEFVTKHLRSLHIIISFSLRLFYDAEGDTYVL